jgi:hypothetical protein
VVEDVGEVSGITTVCGSPSGMVRVGRSTCAGGDARRRRGVRPAHGEIVQLDGSESFTGCQRRCGARNWTKTHWLARSTRGSGRPKSGEVDLGPTVKSGLVRGLGKLHGSLAELDEALARLGGGWSGLAAVAEALAAMAGGNALAGAKERGLAGEGERGVK